MAWPEEAGQSIPSQASASLLRATNSLLGTLIEIPHLKDVFLRRKARHVPSLTGPNRPWHFDPPIKHRCMYVPLHHPIPFLLGSPQGSFFPWLEALPGPLRSSWGCSCGFRQRPCCGSLSSKFPPTGIPGVIGGEETQKRLRQAAGGVSVASTSA
jgi:hypothetical protein